LAACKHWCLIAISAELSAYTQGRSSGVLRNDSSYSFGGGQRHERAENLELEGKANSSQYVEDGAILGPMALMRIEQARAVPTVCASVIHCDCLLRGTNVRTTTGQRKIEDLAIGDLLPTVFDGVRPIQRIGRYPIKKSDPSRPWVKAALSVRVARSAFAPDIPHADLFVTGAHALLIDGVLIPAANLVNLPAICARARRAR
jgi:hypothetical protein